MLELIIGIFLMIHGMYIFGGILIGMFILCLITKL